MMKISVVLPCLNEEKSIGSVIKKIEEVLNNNNLNGEIIVVDNGSNDNSANIIKKFSVKYLFEPRRGYGSAYLKGFEISNGDYIIMADSDGSYDYSQIPDFIAKLEQGFDFVIGSRFKGKIERGSMPLAHKYVGNPLLNLLTSLFFRKRISDSNSGFRAIKKSKLQKLNLRTKGMEFASELTIKAIKNKLKITEIPINYHRRIGKSKLKTFNDGWKHIRFILLYSPTHLFLLPGVIIFLIGLLIIIPLLIGNVRIFGITFQNHPMLIGSAMVILGYQVLLLGIFAKIYAYNHLGERNKFIMKILQLFYLERAIFIGIIFLVSGILIYLYIFYLWLSKNFGALETINLGIFALTLVVISFQTIFSGFFMSYLGIEK